jgi:16S rRNA (adenine1518-N6/adenine1519-N6)-dimethyltransferase
MSPTRKPVPRRPAAKRRRFGQHFLTPHWVRRVIAAIDYEPGDVFLEVGAGAGALTLPLAETGAPILAVEIDRDLVADLGSRVPANVSLMAGDILHLDAIAFVSGLGPQQPPGDGRSGPPARRRFRVVGNLPYSVATPILFRLIELHRRHEFFADATVMLQREVADRLTAKPGRKEYGALSVFAQLHTRIEKVLDLPPTAFKPPPKVRSSVVRLTFGPTSARVPDEQMFERVVKALFMQRRKTVLNALKRFDPAAPAVLALAGIEPGRRPDTLAVAEMARLAELFASVRRPSVL